MGNHRVYIRIIRIIKQEKKKGFEDEVFHSETCMKDLSVTISNATPKVEAV